MADLKLQCSCGKVQGRVLDFSTRKSTRAVCHCVDCQAYAVHLGDNGLLDEYGGTDLVQLTPAQVKIDAGMDQMRCLRLKPKGLYRWYADCCKTPIANTVSLGLPFVGIPHNALSNNGPLDACLGPVNYYIQGKSAKADRAGVKVHDGIPFGWFLASGPWMLSGKFKGKNKPSAFFSDDGRATVKPDVLNQ